MPEGLHVKEPVFNEGTYTFPTPAFRAGRIPKPMRFKAYSKASQRNISETHKPTKFATKHFLNAQDTIDFTSILQDLTAIFVGLVMTFSCRV